MQITIKDIVYTVVYIVSLTAVISAFMHKIKTLNEKCERVMRTLYMPTGGLNLITAGLCKDHRDEVFTAIRKGERLTEELTKEMRILNENVLRIMIHLKIDTPKK